MTAPSKDGPTMTAASTKGPTSLHSHSSKLEDQAATAALYVTKNQAPKSNHPLLDKDGKLSSASAATSLKYAKATDLPWYPSSGLKLSSAGAAASLAHANHKDLELWQQDSIPAAEKAAYLAKDYHADPLWQPELSAAGSKAALLAAREGGHVEIWRPGETEYGASAAEQAMRNTGLSPHIERGVPADSSRRALLAATGAMSGSRRRADSAPIDPEARHDAGWALKAANASKRAIPSVSGGHDNPDSTLDYSRIQNVAKNNINRQMYTANPPVAIEVEEKNRQDRLKASAVAMARNMYNIQQAAIEAAARDMKRSDSQYAANHVHKRRPSMASDVTADEPRGYPQYTNLQEAAQKLATERLAKLHDEHAEYRQYYGASTPSRSRLSMRMRRRASSDGQASDIDAEQSRKIRTQMSLFQSKLAEVDQKKRQGDRDALMAAAQRNVAARMQTMDDRVFEETGKVSPALMQEWEAKARDRAQQDSDTRLENHGRVHIGKGKYLDQADIDAVARARLQPTFDEITEKAEAQRARDEEIRLEQEEQRRQVELEKTRAAELKAEQKRVQDAEKQEARAKRAEEQRIEKAKRDEEKRVQKEEKRGSKDAKTKGILGGIFGLTPGAAAGTTAATGGTSVAATTEAPVLDPIPTTEPLATTPGLTEVAPVETTGSVEHEDEFVSPIEPTSPSTNKDDGLLAHLHSPDTTVTLVPLAEAPAVLDIETEPVVSTKEGQDVVPTSPIKSEPKIKSWFQKRFSRSAKPTQSSEGLATEDVDKKPAGFVGGAALTGAAASTTSPSNEKAREDSIREVAMVGRTSTNETRDEGLYSASEPEVSPPVQEEAERRGRSSPSISSMSWSDEEQAEQKSKRRGRFGFKDKLLGKTTSRGSNDEDNNDEFEEARDTFEEEKLAPPPKMTTVSGEASGRASGSPIRDSKFSEDL